jgi:catechol 2,3-dioxygenase-like lactoylglutathione lyase family enzyme
MADDESPLGVVDLAATTLYVADLDAAISWYRSVLGLQPLMVGTDAHRYAIFQLGGALVVLEPIEAAIEPAVPGTESTTINLIVSRGASQVRDDLLNRGAGCSEIVESPHYHSFLMRDPDGNRFYVAQPVVSHAP